MSTNPDLVRQMVACYSAMDAQGLGALLHPNARHSAPGSDFGADLQGDATIGEYFKTQVFPSFERVDFEIVHLYEDLQASVVVAEWRSHLFPKNGREYRNSGVFVVEVKEGKIYWVREYFDTERAHQNV